MRNPDPDPDPPSRWLTPARIAGLLVIAAGIMGAQVMIDLLSDAVARGELGRTGYQVGLFALLAVVLPVMAGGIYLVHKGRIDAPEADR
jgi:hypothetical protein